MAGEWHLTNEEMRQALGIKPERTFGGTMKDIGVTLGNAAIGAGESVVGLANLATGGLAGKAMNAVGYDPKAAREFLGQYYSDAQKAANREVDEAKGFWDTTAAMLRNPSTIANAVVESAPSMFIGGGVGGKGLQMAARYMAKNAPKMAEKYLAKDALGNFVKEGGNYVLNKAGRERLGSVFGAVGEGAVAGGALAEQMRQENADKELTGRQALFAGLGGLGTGLLGRGGNALARRLGITDVDQMLTTRLPGEGFKKLTAGQIAKGIGGGALVEGVAEELPQSMQEQLWQNLGTGKPWHEDVLKSGAQGMLAGMVMGGAANARASLPDMQRRIQAIQDAEAQEPQRLMQERARLFGTAMMTDPAARGQAIVDDMYQGIQERRRSVGAIGKALEAGGVGITGAANRAPDVMNSVLAQQQTEADLTPEQRNAVRLAQERAAQPETEAQRIVREQAELELARKSPSWGESVAQAEAALAKARRTATTREEIREAEANLRMVVELSRPDWDWNNPAYQDAQRRRMDAMAAAEQEQERLYGMRPEVERLRNALTGVRAQRGRHEEQEQQAARQSREDALRAARDSETVAKAAARAPYRGDEREQPARANGAPSSEMDSAFGFMSDDLPTAGDSAIEAQGDARTRSQRAAEYLGERRDRKTPLGRAARDLEQHWREESELELARNTPRSAALIAEAEAELAEAKKTGNARNILEAESNLRNVVEFTRPYWDESIQAQQEAQARMDRSHEEHGRREKQHQGRRLSDVLRGRIGFMEQADRDELERLYGEVDEILAEARAYAPAARIRRNRKKAEERMRRQAAEQARRQSGLQEAQAAQAAQPQETPEVEEPPIQKQAEHNLPGKKTGGNAAKSGSASKAGVVGNRGAGEFMFNADGAPMLGYRPGTTRQNAGQTRLENAVEPATNAAETNRGKSAAQSTVTSKAERTMAREESEQPVAPATSAAAQPQEAEQSRDSEIRRERAQRKLAESKEKQRRAEAGRQRKARIQAVKDRVESSRLPGFGFRPASQRQAQADEVKAAAQAIEQGFRERYGDAAWENHGKGHIIIAGMPESKSAEAPQKQAEKQAEQAPAREQTETAEADETLDEREWKKPGVRSFDKEMEKSWLGGYGGVTLNGEKTDGFTDGHVLFVDLTPEAMSGKPRGKSDGTDFVVPLTFEDTRQDGTVRGNLGGGIGSDHYANDLTYRGVVGENAVFERKDGRDAVLMGDGYLNAIMYYAKRRHGENAAVRFLQSTMERGEGGARTKYNPILVTVNGKPFAIIMPVKKGDSDPDLADLVEQARRQRAETREREREKAEQAKRKPTTTEGNELLSERRWTKPKKGVFNTGGFYGDGDRYIAVGLNDGGYDGYSNGYVSFFNFFPDAALEKKSTRHDEHSVDVTGPRDDGSVMVRTGVKAIDRAHRYGNELFYRGVTEADEDDGYVSAVFEQAESDKKNWPVTVNDAYLNAVMYYAQQVHGRDVRVRLLQEDGGSRNIPSNWGAIIVLANDTPFAMIAPTRNEESLSKLIGNRETPAARRQEAPAEQAPAKAEAPAEQKPASSENPLLAEKLRRMEEVERNIPELQTKVERARKLSATAKTDKTKKSYETRAKNLAREIVNARRELSELKDEAEVIVEREKNPFTPEQERFAQSMRETGEATDAAGDVFSLGQRSIIDADRYVHGYDVSIRDSKTRAFKGDIIGDREIFASRERAIQAAVEQAKFGEAARGEKAQAAPAPAEQAAPKPQETQEPQETRGTREQGEEEKPPEIAGRKVLEVVRTLMDDYRKRFGDTEWAERLGGILGRMNELMVRVMNDPTLRNAIANSDRQNAEFEHIGAVTDAFTGLVTDFTKGKVKSNIVPFHNEFSTNKEFRDWLIAASFEAVYDALKPKTDAATGERTQGEPLPKTREEFIRRAERNLESGFILGGFQFFHRSNGTTEVFNRNLPDLPFVGQFSSSRKAAEAAADIAYGKEVTAEQDGTETTETEETTNLEAREQAGKYFDLSYLDKDNVRIVPISELVKGNEPLNARTVESTRFFIDSIEKGINKNILPPSYVRTRADGSYEVEDPTMFLLLKERGVKYGLIEVRPSKPTSVVQKAKLAGVDVEVISTSTLSQTPAQSTVPQSGESERPWFGDSPVERAAATMSDAEGEAMLDAIFGPEEGKPKKPLKELPLKERAKASKAGTRAKKAIKKAKRGDKELGQIAKEGGKAAIGTVKEIFAGLDKLFTPKNTLGSGIIFTEESYQAAKPHFIEAWKNAIRLKYSIEEFFAGLLERYGQPVAPFARRFWQDLRSGAVEINMEEENNGAQTEREEADGTSAQLQQNDDDVAGNRPGALEAVSAEVLQGNGRGEPERAGDRGGAEDAGRDSGAVAEGLPVPRGGRDGAGEVRAGEAGAGRRGGKRGVRPGEPDPNQTTSPAAIPARNFRITPELELGKGGPVQKYNDNVAAIRALKRIQRENRRATPEEQAILARYVGWGGLADAFRRPDGSVKEGWEKRVEEVEALLTPEELKTARSSTQNAHYTSQDVVSAIWRGMTRLGFKGGNVLEPSVGTGNFLGLMPQELAGSTRFTAAEFDNTTAAIAQLLYPNENIRHTPFEKLPLVSGGMDAMVGNPPFGQTRLVFPSNPRLNRHSIHNQFVLASLQSLRPGGVMGFVVSRYLMDNRDDTVRREIAGLGKLLGAIRLPGTAFKENAGTEVVTDIIFLQRYTKEEQEAYDPSRTPEWIGTTDIMDDQGQNPMPVNNWFAGHPERVLGELNRQGSMWRENDIGVTYKGDDLAGDLNRMIDAVLPLNVATGFEPKRSEQAHQEMVEHMNHVLSGKVVGDMSFNESGELVQIYDRESVSDSDELVLTSRVLTPETPWSEDLTQASDGRWYEDVDKLGPDGKPLKVRGANGRLTNRNQKERRWYNEDEIPANKRLGETGYERLRDAVGLLDVLREQIRLESEDAPEKDIEANRTKLNRAYDAFTRKHKGYINDPHNARLIEEIATGSLLLSLENNYRKKAKGRPASADKADILSRRVNFPAGGEIKVRNAGDALGVNLSEMGRVDIGHIAGLLGKSHEEVIAELCDDAEKPLIFFDPETQLWTKADEYLSGNVRRKLNAAVAARDAAAAEGASQREQKRWEKTVAALQAVQPKRWESHQITPIPGASWIPTDVYADFYAHLTGGRADVEYSALTHTFGVSATESGGKESSWNTPDRSVADLLNALLNSRQVKIQRREGNKTYTDTEASQACNDKIQEIKEEFSNWVFMDSDRRERLTDIFNDRYNVRVVKQNDGSHLRLPGKVPDNIIKMRRHQLNAIWRGIMDKFVLYDHAVGAGKTFTGIARAMERRRMGLSRKPMIVVPNHLVNQFASDVYRLYPGAKVLAAGKADMERSKRRRLFGRIATGDWDIVIVPHSSFGFIGIDPSTEESYIEQELEQVYEAIVELQEQDKASGGRGKSPAVKAAEALRDKLEARLDKLRAKNSRKDRLLTFEQMGVDDLTVDEAHEFKNLFYNSNMQAAGMNPRAGSAKAYDLWTKVRMLRESGGSVAFMTGTPISNSAVEMYTMMRYLAADELADLDLENFDAWRTQYVEASDAFEPTESGSGLKLVTRIGREWNNMRSLMDLYYSFADCVSNEDIQQWYLEDTGEEFPLPKVKGGGRQAVNVEPTPEQARILDEIISGFNGLKGIRNIKERNATRLRLMDRARKVSLDARAVEPNSPGEEGGKIGAVCDRVYDLYQKSAKGKGTQLVFLDRSVPKSNGDAKILEAYDKLLAALEAAERDGDEAAARKAVEDLEKYDPNEMEEIRRAQQGGWTAYQQIKDNLVAMGIPANEIRFVQEANTDAQKQDLFDAVKRGEVRVLLGSTQRMGAGTNVQDRLVALHHVDVGWKPSDIEQREGRIIRQGNLFATEGSELYDPNFQVEILAYTTERTIDAKMWSLNSSKLKMINGIRKYGGEFNMEFDDSDSVGMAEIAAIASGDPLQLERVQLDSEITRLERQKRNFQRQQFATQDAIKKAERTLQNAPDEIAFREKYGRLVETGLEEERAWKAGLSVVIDGETYTGETRKEAYAHVAELVRENNESQGRKALSVEIDGVKLHAQGKINDALEEKLGDNGTFAAELNGKRYASAALMRRKIAELVNAAVKGKPDEIGDARIGVIKKSGLEFELSVSTQMTTDRRGTPYKEAIFYIEQKVDGKGEAKHRIAVSYSGAFLPGGETLNLASIPGLFNEIIKEAAALPGSAEWTRRSLTRAEKALPNLREEAKKTFPKQDELDQKKRRLAEVEQILDAQAKAAENGGYAASAEETGDAKLSVAAVPVENRADIEGELQAAIGKTRANKILRARNGNVRIVETQEEARRMVGADNPTVKRAGNGTIQGFYLNGVAYLVRDGIAKGNVMGVLMHEYGEHAAQLGFRDNVGYRAILESLKRRQNENSETGKAIQAAMQRVPEGTAEDDFWSEVAAYLVEANANVKTTTLDRVTHFFKKWLFKVSGLGADNFTHKDLVLFARAAVKAGSRVRQESSNARLTMYRAREASLSEFAKRAQAEGGNAKKSYYSFSIPGELEGIEFKVPSDTFVHQGRRHPDMTATDIDRLPDIIASLDTTTLIYAGRDNDGEGLAGMSTVKGVDYGVLFSKSDNGSSVYIHSFFKDSPKGLRNWLKRKEVEVARRQKRKASKGRGDAASATKQLPTNPASTLGKPVGKTLRQILDDVKPSVPAPGGARLSFAGEQGAAALDAAEEATTRLDNLAVARDMEKAGKDAKTIKLATGWERGKDGKWRYEIDDSGNRVSLDGDMDLERKQPGYRRYKELLEKYADREMSADERTEFDRLSEQFGAVLTRQMMKTRNARKGVSLHDVLEAPELFKAYPQLKNVRVKLDWKTPEGDGNYNNATKTITLGYGGSTNSLLRSTLHHEVQHAIQYIEGFAKGGTPEQMADYDKQRESNEAFDKLQAIEREHRDAVRDFIVRNGRRYIDEWTDADVDENGAFSEPYNIGGKNVSSLQALASAVTDRMIDDGATPEKALADIIRDADGAMHEFFESEGIYDDAPQKLAEIARRHKNQKAALDAIGTQDPLTTYKRLGGETEARNVQRRLGMTPEQRRASLAEETEDVAREDQIVLEQMLGDAAASNGPRFSIAAASTTAAPAANPAANNAVTGRSFVDRILDHAGPKYRDMWERFIYNFLDTNDPRERVWRKAGSPTDQDFVTVERLRGKKAAAEQKKFREEMVTPMLETLGKGGLSVSDLEEYAHAMHTPERNQKMREVNAKRNLDALRRHMSKAEAQNLQDQMDFIRNVGKQNGWTQADIQNAYLGLLENVFRDIPRREAELAQKMHNLTSSSSQNARAHVEKMRRDLEETKRIRDQWRRESVRFAGQTDDEARAAIDKWRRDNRFAALRRAHEQLEAITAATLDVLHESGQLDDEEYQGMKDGYRHYVPLHRDGFLDTTPIRLLQVAKGSSRAVIDIVANVVRSHETAVNRKHKAAAGKALYEFAEAHPDAGISIEEMEMKPTHDQEGNIVMYRSQAEPEDGVFVRVNGKKYLLRFAASSKSAEGRTLLRFLDSVKGSDAQLGGLTKMLHAATRWLAMVNTSLSPEFMVTNFARDLQTAFIHLNQKDINMDGLQRAVAKDVFPAMKGIWAAERGDKSGAMAKWYEDFQTHGGKVGWMQGYDEATKVAKELEEELKLFQDGHRILKTRKKMMQLVEHGNAAIENCMRLATYKNLVERGVSRDKAARVASGLTVDFTQHGKMSPQINALYMFFNASVQGTVRMTQALASSRKVQAIAGGIAGAGFVLQMLALAGGGDDDSGEPNVLGIPDSIRERNIIIMLPGSDGKKYIKIPKAYGYGAIYDIGAELANSIYMGAQGRKYNHAAGAMRVVNSFANSFNPIQSATVLQTLAPTLLDPVAYVSENKTWAGTPLMPEQNPYGPSKPDSERAWKGTSAIWKKTAQVINDMTGGDKYQGGWADVSPETLSMVWDNATGGMGRFIGNVVSLPFSVAAGETEAHKVPFARQVYGEWNDRSISSRYYEAMDRAEIAHMRFKNAESLPERKRLYRTPDHQLYLQSRAAEKEIRALRKRQQAMEAAGNRDGAERIRTRIVAAQSKVLSAML